MNYIPYIDMQLTAQEVCDIREMSGWDHEIKEWENCLSRNIINVSVRNDSGIVIGVGFLTGNLRHAELTDLVVHPEHKQQGLGRLMVKLINDYAIQHNIKYYGLTYDKTFPWLKEFYESEGFELIDFGMWHKHSLGK